MSKDQRIKDLQERIFRMSGKIKSHEANIKMRADHVERLQEELASSQTEANDLRVRVEGLLLEIEER